MSAQPTTRHGLSRWLTVLEGIRPFDKSLLSKDVIAVVSEAAITEKLTATGQAVRTGGPAELTKTLKDQAQQMAKVAAAIGLKAGQ